MFEDIDNTITPASMLSRLQILDSYEPAFGFWPSGTNSVMRMEIAKMAIDVFLKYPCVDFHDTIIMVAAYLIHNNELSYHIDAMKLIDTKSPAVSVYNAHAHMCHTTLLTEENEELKAGYIALIALAKNVLETCIHLLGFYAPDKM